MARKAPPGAKSDPVPWTEYEINCIKRYYPLLGPRGTAKKLKRRSRSSVAAKAFRMGVSVGSIDGHVRASGLDNLTGSVVGTARHAAIRQGVGRVTDNGEVYVVPIEWAEKWAEEIGERYENDALADEWYDIWKVMKLFNASYGTVHKWARGFRGEYADAFSEIDVRKTSRRNDNKLLFNPWQVEDLLRRIRRGDAVLSLRQAETLVALDHEGRSLRLERVDPYSVPPIEKWFVVEEDGRRVMEVRRGTLTSLRTHKLVTAADKKSQRDYVITDRGREEAAEISERQEDVL